VVRSSFLRKEDSDIADEFQKVFLKDHSVHQGWSPVEVSQNNGTFNLVCKNAEGNKKNLKADALLVASGVVPETAGLGLEILILNWIQTVLLLLITV